MEKDRSLYNEAMEIMTLLELELEPFTLSSLLEETPEEQELMRDLATYLFVENEEVDLHYEIKNPKFTEKMANWFKKEIRLEKVMGWV